MTTTRTRLVLGAALALAMAAAPTVSAAQAIPQRGRSREHRLDRNARDDRYERRDDRDDRDDRDERRDDRDSRYGRYSRYDPYSRSDRYGLERSCRVEYHRLIANDRRQERQWYRNHGYSQRNTRRHELQRQRKFERRLAQLRRRCGSVPDPWTGRYVYGGTRIDRNGDGRIDRRDRSHERRDQRYDDPWSWARRRSGGS